MKLYHLTPKSKLANILKEGLDPKYSKSSLKAIFLTDDLFTAFNYASMKDERKFVVLAVDVKNLNPKELGPDNYELQDWLESKSNNTDHENWNEVDWEFSLEKVNQVAYYGIIDPSLLEVIEK